MFCKDVMHRDVVCASPDQTVQWAATQMRNEDIGFIPVCDDHDTVVGTLTDRDLALRCVAAGLPETTRIAEVMSHEVISCKPDDDLRVAEARMSAAQKKRILCLDDSGRLQGVISISDILATEPADVSYETMRHIKEPVATQQFI